MPIEIKDREEKNSNRWNRERHQEPSNLTWQLANKYRRTIAQEQGQLMTFYETAAHLNNSVAIIKKMF